MANPNPIKYSDLVAPDSSITDLIQQLQELIDEYNKAKSVIQSSANDISKSMQGMSGATDEQRKEISELVKEVDNLENQYRKISEAQAQAKAEQKMLSDANREAVKIQQLKLQEAQAEEGSYNKLSAQYRLMKIQLNQMGEADEKATKKKREMEVQARKLYEQMSNLQKATGKYTLEVGHYENALRALPGPIGKVVGEGMRMGKSFGDIKTAAGGLAQSLGMSTGGMLATLGLVAGSVAAAVGAFKLWKNSIESTQATGDIYREHMQALEAGFDRFKKAIATADFSNLISGMIDASQAARELYKVLDEAFERANSLALLRASMGEENEAMLEMLRDQRLTLTERMEAGKAYIANMEELYERETKLAKDSADAQLEYLFSVTNTTKYASEEEREAAKQQLADYIQEYDINKERIAQAREFIRIENELNNAVIEYGQSEQIAANLSESASKVTQERMEGLRKQLQRLGPEIGELAKVVKQYNLTEDSEVTAYVEAQKKYLNARNAMARDNRRIITQIHTLENQLLKDQKKATEERETLARRDEEARASLLESMAHSEQAIAEQFQREAAGAKSMSESVGSAYEDVQDAVKKSGADRIREGDEIYKKIVKLYREKEQEVADAATKEMIDALQKRAGILRFAAENGTEEVWQAIGAKSAEEALEMAKQAEEDAVKIVNAANKAMKDRGKQLSWKFYEPEQGWSLFSPETPSEGGTQSPTKPTKPTGGGRSSQGWSLQNDKAFQRERLALLKQYQNDEIKSRSEFDMAVAILELNTMKKRLAGLKANSAERMKLEAEVIEKEMALDEKRKKAYEKAKAEEEKAQADAAKEREKTDKKAQKASLEQLQMELRVIDLEIEATKEGTDEIIRLRYARLQKQMEIELEQNRQTEEALRIDESLIIAKYRKMGYEIAKAAEDGASSGTKRYGSVLDVIFGYGPEGDDEEAKKQRQRIEDIKDGLSTITSEVANSVSSIISSWEQAAEAAVQAADKQVDSAQKVVDAEREAAANGYANNVKRAEKELALAKKNQAAALKEQERAQKAQAALDSLTQAGSLVTASANLWSAFSPIPYVGPALAVAAIAMMWGSFAAAKIKAAQVTKTETYGEGVVELLEGGSHASGHDISLGRKSNGVERRAEGGEFFAVINKRNSRRYRDVIPDVINSLNDGTFADKYQRANTAMAGYAVQMIGGANLTKLEKGVEAIREQGETRRSYEGGVLVLRYKNLTRKIKS